MTFNEIGTTAQQRVGRSRMKAPKEGAPSVGDRVLVIGSMGPRAGVIAARPEPGEARGASEVVGAEPRVSSSELWAVNVDGLEETWTLKRSQFIPDPVTPEIRSMIEAVCSPSASMPEVLEVVCDWLLERKLMRFFAVAKKPSQAARRNPEALACIQAIEKEKAHATCLGQALAWCHSYTGFRPGSYRMLKRVLDDYVVVEDSFSVFALMPASSID